uniref:Uncharacterized protein n=1 Tax=Arundo donax TaxID=35708 RepID=A0A0A9BSF7_ARUDO
MQHENGPCKVKSARNGDSMATWLHEYTPVSLLYILTMITGANLNSRCS